MSTPRQAIKCNTSNLNYQHTNTIKWHPILTVIPTLMMLKTLGTTIKMMMTKKTNPTKEKKRRKKRKEMQLNQQIIAVGYFLGFL